MIKPSEKLLSVVKEFYVLSKHGERLEDMHRDMQADIRDFWNGTDYCSGLNKHELMSIMKEWIRDRDYYYEIKTYMLHRKVTIVLYRGASVFSCNTINIELSESDAVIKACEWILEQQ